MQKNCNNFNLVSKKSTKRKRKKQQHNSRLNNDMRARFTHGILFSIRWYYYNSASNVGFPHWINCATDINIHGLRERYHTHLHTHAHTHSMLTMSDAIF